MQCPRCNAPIEENTTFCGNCGNQIAPLQAQGATIAAPAEQTQPSLNNPISLQSKYGMPGPMLQASQQAQHYAPMPNTPIPVYPIPPPSRRPNIGLIALIVGVILLVIAGGTIALVSVMKNNNGGTVPANTTGGNATGIVRFLDSQNNPGHTDTLNITLENLAAAPAGSQYDAWLLNDQNEQQITKLGTLTAANQEFSLSYTQKGTNLLGLGNKLEITLDTSDQSKADVPTGKVILVGTFPPRAFIHIKHLLFSFPTTPNHIGLLVGLQNQAQLVNSEAQLLQNFAGSHNSPAIQCVAQGMVDIIEGAQSPHYREIGPQCGIQNITIGTGDGFGLLGSNGYLTTAAAHASFAATSPDATNLIRVHAGHVEICISNIKGWLTTVDQDVLDLVSYPDHTSKLQEIVTLTDHAYHGVDTNGDEQIDPVPGEGGAITAYIHGHLMATLTLVPGA